MLASPSLQAAGKFWRSMNNGLYGGAINALAIDSSSPQTVYAGTYGSGVFKLLPSPFGDTDADGKSDISVWRPDSGIWYILTSGAPGTYTTRQWGLAKDVAISPLTGILHSVP